MDRMTGSTSTLSGILTETIRERLSLRADMNMNGGLAFSLDETRAAALGRLAELPSLGECLAGWQQRIIDDACRDYPIPFRDLELNADGRLAFSEENGPLPMTYRTFGSLLRRYCAPPRNVARVLFELPVLEKGLHSPRACAYNAYLERHNAPERARLAIVGGEEGPEIIWLRSRLLRQAEIDPGKRPPPVRTIIAGLSPTHSLQSGDDDKLITALTIAFAGAGATARASAFRGIDESEMRAVFPALEVQIADAGSEKWMGYVTARNSESGAKSWSISAGLYRTKDGASVACEAILRTGRHVGTKVPERMVEVAQGAAEMLQKLVTEASALAGRMSIWSEQETLKRIREALGGTVLHDPDTCCGIAWALGEATALGDPITVGTLMNILGRAAGAMGRRIDARPIEVMLGRVLVHGWKELRAVATDVEADEEEG